VQLFGTQGSFSSTCDANLFLEPLATFFKNLQTEEPFAKLRFSFKIKACEKFYHRHMIDIPRINF